MPDSIREKVLDRLKCVLSNIRSGLLIEACNRLPEPFFELLDGCDDQDSVDGWAPSGVADTPTLNTTTFLKAPGAINLIKTSVGTMATWEKTLSASFNATIKLGALGLRTTDRDLFNINNAITIKFGTDSSNYFERVFGKIVLQNGGFVNFLVGIDDITGLPSTVVGAPDITAIKYLSITAQTATGGTDVLEGELIMDFWTLFDDTAWAPISSAEAPEVIFEDPPPVIGLSFIGFGRRAPNSELAFGIQHIFPTPVDGTGGELESWVFIHDKNVLNPASALGSVGILVASSLSDFFVKTLFFDDLIDRVNDSSSGWNQILFTPETESDLVLGNPDIENLVGIAVLAGAVSDISIPVGDLGIDFIRFTNLAGDFLTDVKHVYRYQIGTYQTMGTPIIMMAALKEDKVSKVFPIVHNRLTVGIDGEIELADEQVLDKELGKLATDIEVALAKEQELYGVARYVELKQFEFSVKEGTSTGILTGIIEVEYAANKIDPTKQGL